VDLQRRRLRTAAAHRRRLHLCRSAFDVDFRKYAKEGFDWEDQVRTATWLAAHRGPVVLVNQATSRIRRLYKDLGFRLEYVSAPRRINSTGDRTPAREVIATRNI
jgi:DNA adenine methylase